MKVECPGPSGREQSLGRRRREAEGGAVGGAVGREGGEPGSKVSRSHTREIYKGDSKANHHTIV